MILQGGIHLILFKTREFFKIVSGAKVSANAVKNGNVDVIVCFELFKGTSKVSCCFLESDEQLLN